MTNLDSMRPTPDLLGYVYGVRGWNNWTGYEGPDGMIHSLDGWEAGINVASCRLGGAHLIPDLKCGCGLYGYYGVSRFEHRGHYGAIIGLVRGWGRLSVADDGWRAQFAEVVAIYDQSPNAESIAKAFDVPTMTLDEMDFLSRNHTVPVHMRPTPRMAVEKPIVVSHIDRGPTIPTLHSSVHRELWEALIAMSAVVGLLVAIGLGVSFVLSVAVFLAVVLLTTTAGWLLR